MPYLRQFTVHDLTGIAVAAINNDPSYRACCTYAISPPNTSTRHSNPMQTPRIGTFPVKCLIASREIPESVCGCPGPGEITRYLILSKDSADADIASLRTTFKLRLGAIRQSDWYRFQVKESKLSMSKMSIGNSRPGGKITLDNGLDSGISFRREISSAPGDVV